MAQKKNTAMAQATKALAIANQLQGSLEKKFLVTSLLQNVDKVGHIYTLNSLDQGLGDSSRTGDRIMCTRVGFDLWRAIPGSASGRFSLRFLIIIDKQDTIDSVDKVFLGTDSLYCPFLQFVKDYRRAFVVLYDSRGNHMDQYNKGDCLHYSRKINLRTQFNSGTANINTGSIKLICISSQSESSNQKPILLGSLRVDFTDA